MTHRGGPLNPGRGTVARHEAGRICEEPACETRLSIYNSAPRCSLHEFRMVKTNTTFDRAPGALWLAGATASEFGQPRRVGTTQVRQG
jgi:hypothetical protein